MGEHHPVPLLGWHRGETEKAVSPSCSAGRAAWREPSLAICPSPSYSSWGIGGELSWAPQQGGRDSPPPQLKVQQPRGCHWQAAYVGSREKGSLPPHHAVPAWLPLLGSWGGVRLGPPPSQLLLTVARWKRGGGGGSGRLLGGYLSAPLAGQVQCRQAPSPTGQVDACWLEWTSKYGSFVLEHLPNRLPKHLFTP